MSQFILASNSPRRKALLELLEIPFVIEASNIEEILDPLKPIEEAVMDLAFQKGVAVFRHHLEDVILAFDTIVIVDGQVLGKPVDKGDAKRMLQLLSDKTHIVITAGAILSKQLSTTFYEKARVTFCALSEAEIDDYIESAEPFDKAGAYAVQGLGAKFVRGINGDYYAIMGLPVSRLYQELKRFGL
ncbi:MAG: Maf family protein [bacterium]|nr:Maf family protein [bacterium]